MANTRQSLSQPDIQWGSEQLPPGAKEKLNRLTQSVRALITEMQRVQQLLAGGTTGQVLEKTGTADYQGAWANAGSVAVTGAENVGSGAGLFEGLDGTLLQFKSLIQGANIHLTVSGTSITISATGGGGGGAGTVTSVGIDSDDLVVTGSPIEDSGSIELEIGPNKVTYPKMQQTSADSVVLGRRTGEGLGQIEELTAADLLAILALPAASTGYPGQLGYAGIV